MTKRLFALLLCLVMCLSLLPTAAFADAEIPEENAAEEEVFEAPAEEPESVEEPAESPAEDPAPAPIEDPAPAEEAAEEPAPVEEPAEEAADAFEDPAPAEQPAEEVPEDVFAPVEPEAESVKDEAAMYSDDPAGGSPQTVRDVLLSGQQISVSIGTGGTFAYYRFMNYCAGDYTFTSSCTDGDPIGYLYDKDWKLLLRVDDSDGLGRNFALSYTIEPEKTYYLCVGYYSSGATGSIPVKVTKDKTGWCKQGDWWFYFHADSTPADGVETINGKTYGFISTGMMAANMTVRDPASGNFYACGSDGVVITTPGWKRLRGSYDGESWDYWVYITDSSGKLATGWNKIGGAWYYFGSANARMYANGVYIIHNRPYYLGSGGAMQTGWIKGSYTWYTVDGREIKDTVWYYADNPSGVLQTGWQTIGGKKYYFDPNNYFMYVGCHYGLDGKNYFFTSSGALAGAGWQSQDYTLDPEPHKEWFYCNADGTCVTGWKKVGSTWYYFAADTCWMVSGGIRWIGGFAYYFSSSGAMQTGWIKDSYTWTDDAGKQITEVTWYYAEGSGHLVTGWQTIGGKKYYFDPNDYAMKANMVFNIDGINYFFTSSGALAGAGWQSVKYEYNGTNETIWYYCNANGCCETGWKKIGSSWYYFSKENGHEPYMCAGGLYWVDGKWEFFKASGAWVATGSNTAWRRDGDDMKYYKDGKMVKGWAQIEGEWYFFDRTTGAMRRGWVWDGGKGYHCDPAMISNEVWVEDEGQFFIFGTDGALVTKTGWYKRTVTFNGATSIEWYHVRLDNGILSLGLKTINGKLYYFHPRMASDETIEINGVEYYFDSSGAGRKV